MHIERLLDLARQHVEKLKAKKPDVPACLTDDDITVYQPDDNDGTTSLESILGMFFNPTEDKLGIRVSSGASSFSSCTLAQTTSRIPKIKNRPKVFKRDESLQLFLSRYIRKSSSWKHGFENPVGPVLLAPIPHLKRQQ